MARSLVIKNAHVSHCQPHPNGEDSAIAPVSPRFAPKCRPSSSHANQIVTQTVRKYEVHETPDAQRTKVGLLPKDKFLVTPIETFTPHYVQISDALRSSRGGLEVLARVDFRLTHVARLIEKWDKGRNLTD